jgi:hypothetical protein
LVDGVEKIHVRCEERPHVHLAAAARSYGPNLLVLEHAQQLRLHRRAHFANLVKQQRPAIGLDEDAVVGTVRSSERASDVTEQLAFQQGFGDRGAVDGDKGLLAPWARCPPPS